MFQGFTEPVGAIAGTVTSDCAFEPDASDDVVLGASGRFPYADEDHG